MRAASLDAALNVGQIMINTIDFKIHTVVITMTPHLQSMLATESTHLSDGIIQFFSNSLNKHVPNTNPLCYYWSCNAVCKTLSKLLYGISKCEDEIRQTRIEQMKNIASYFLRNESSIRQFLKYITAHIPKFEYYVRMLYAQNDDPQHNGKYKVYEKGALKHLFFTDVVKFEYIKLH